MSAELALLVREGSPILGKCYPVATGPEGLSREETMKTKACILTALAIFCAAAMAAQVSSQVESRGNLPHYTVVDLGTFGTAFALGQGINDRGWVDGIFGNQNQHEFVLRNGVVSDLGTLGGPNSGVGSFGQSPNERGQIVGAAENSAIDPLAEGFCHFLTGSAATNNVCLPFIWQNDVITALPTLGGTNGGASQINNRGQIVGTAETPDLDTSCGVSHLLFEPVLWEQGVPHQLPTIGGDVDGGVDAINDLGQAVGATGTCTTAFHAVLWEKGLAKDLGNLGGTFNFEGTSINNNSQVVGFSDIAGDATFHAFLWQDGVIADLGTLSGDFLSFASAINNGGQIVGTSCADSMCASSRGFVWQNGAMLDLNTLISGSNLVLANATGINDRGEIVGFTADFHAFLATPCDDRDVDGEGCQGSGEVIAAGQPARATLPESLRQRLLRRWRFGSAIH